jgi:hypothetical protein
MAMTTPLHYGDQRGFQVDDLGDGVPLGRFIGSGLFGQVG